MTYIEGRAHSHPCADQACPQFFCRSNRPAPLHGGQTANTPVKLPCRVCDEDEPRITTYRCEVCKYPICEEHKTSQHCEDCYP